MYNSIKIEEALEPKGNYNISYREWGDPNNKKVLVCVHGILRNCRDFDYFAQSMSDIYRVICIDIVGRGNSDWLESARNYNNAFYCRGILKMLSSLNINSIDWVGSSLGGILGMMVAKRQNNLIKKLVLNDIGAFMNGDHIKFIYTLLIKTYDFDQQKDAEDYLRKMLSEFGIKNEEIWQQVFENSIVKDGNKYRYNYDKNIYNNMSDRIDTDSDVNLWDLWREVKSEVLILRGSKSKYLSQDVLDLMLKGRDNVQSKIYDNIGHTPSLMYYNQVQDIRDFLCD